MSSDTLFRHQAACNKQMEGSLKRGCGFPFNIFLIGFMGCGKSAIADCLSSVFSMELIEMDQMIVKQEGMEISDIFKAHGEEYFRSLETGLLNSLQSKQNTVISCGGGVPLREENVTIMRKNGKIILLSASPETIYSRVKDSHSRPLLENNKTIPFISELMEKRREKYEAAADIAIQTDGKKIMEICEEIALKLQS